MNISSHLFVFLPNLVFMIFFFLVKKCLWLYWHEYIQVSMLCIQPFFNVVVIFTFKNYYLVWFYFFLKIVLVFEENNNFGSGGTICWLLTTNEKEIFEIIILFLYVYPLKMLDYQINFFFLLFISYTHTVGLEPMTLLFWEKEVLVKI